jgi:hypothetical protein
VRTLPRAAATVAVVLALAACDGADGDGAAPTGPSPSASPSASGATDTPSPTSTPTRATPTPSPTDEPAIGLPPDAPTTFDLDAPPADLPLEQLVPPGAEVDATWILNPPEDPFSQLGVVWSRGDDPLFRERGVALWQPFPEPPTWRVVYAFTDPLEEGVLGIRMSSADLTGDGLPDLLTFEDVGGSGACGTWRVIASGDASAAEVFRRRTCDAQLSIVADHLELREAVFQPGDSHCCPSAYRTTTLDWDGERFVRTDVTESPAPPP